MLRQTDRLITELETTPRIYHRIMLKNVKTRNRHYLLSRCHSCSTHHHNHHCMCYHLIMHSLLHADRVRTIQSGQIAGFLLRFRHLIPIKLFKPKSMTRRQISNTFQESEFNNCCILLPFLHVVSMSSCCRWLVMMHAPLMT
jgi:hypothetical protein